MLHDKHFKAWNVEKEKHLISNIDAHIKSLYEHFK